MISVSLSDGLECIRPCLVILKTGEGLFTEVVLVDQVFEQLDRDRSGESSIALGALSVCGETQAADRVAARDEDDWVGE